MTTTGTGEQPSEGNPARQHVPHDKVTPGLWYIHIQTRPFYAVVDVAIAQMDVGADIKEGDKLVFVMNEERAYWIEDFDADQFIGPVPAPMPAPIDADAMKSWLIDQAKRAPLLDDTREQYWALAENIGKGWRPQMVQPVAKRGDGQ